MLGNKTLSDEHCIRNGGMNSRGTETHKKGCGCRAGNRRERVELRIERLLPQPTPVSGMRTFPCGTHSSKWGR
jgi:hypothetical protein